MTRHRRNQTTTTTPALDAAEAPSPPLIDLDTAGRMLGRTGRWVERHLNAHRGYGAPEIHGIKTRPDSVRCAAKVVERAAWERWLRLSSMTATAAPSTPVAATDIVVVPEGLLTTAQRRRLAQGRS